MPRTTPFLAFSFFLSHYFIWVGKFNIAFSLALLDTGASACLVFIKLCTRFVTLKPKIPVCYQTTYCPIEHLGQLCPPQAHSRVHGCLLVLGGITWSLISDSNFSHLHDVECGDSHFPQLKSLTSSSRPNQTPPGNHNSGFRSSTICNAPKPRTRSATSPPTAPWRS